MKARLSYIFLFYCLVYHPTAEARQPKMEITVKLLRCSQKTGGISRAGPAIPPTCGPTAGIFLILSRCKSKYDQKTCEQVQRWKSKIGTIKAKLPKGKHHFVWESEATGRVPALPGPCSLDTQSAYDIQVNEPGQIINLTLFQHCSVP